MAIKNIVILAGGRGSRLGKITQNTPKPLLKIGNKPPSRAVSNNDKVTKRGDVNKLTIHIHYERFIKGTICTQNQNRRRRSR